MRHDDGRRGDAPGADALLAVRGRVVGRPRRIRTAEGWEVATLLLGPVGPSTPGEPPGALPVVCTGAGACDAASALRVGGELVVVGRVVARRAACAADDRVELEAHALLARRRRGRRGVGRGGA